MERKRAEESRWIILACLRKGLSAIGAHLLGVVDRMDRVDESAAGLDF